MRLIVVPSDASLQGGELPSELVEPLTGRAGMRRIVSDGLAWIILQCKTSRMRTLVVAVLFVGSSSLGACKKAPPPAPSAQGEATTHSAAVVDPLASVKAKLPKSGPAALPLELARIELPRKGKTLVFAAPSGWTSDNEMMPGRLKKPGSGGFGKNNHVDVGSTCEGVCAPKDWKPIIEEKAKQRVADGPGTHDEVLPGNRRVRWGIDANGASVYAAWYEDGASELNECSVWLQDPALHPALDAFVEICKTAKIEK